MRKRFKCLIGATAAAVVVTPVVYVGYAMTHRDAGSPTTVGCSTVMAFAGGKLPTQAAGASCTDDNTWQEQGYSAEFRMPRADLPARLTEAFPRVRQETSPSSGLRFSNDDQAAGAHPSGQAAVVRLEVAYEDAETARVSLRAFGL